ncbi:NAD(P)H-dependent oxidoreductase [Candidatus Campbellbacteria bacterium]|nr:NAD(P)H-dependent oxidoreductase [Candidatus Campbellbacteria bacterium]|tara:strand:+ start:4198 stop:4830 length:633 start_codon:yes stop_codon:yes gene_type:complete
MPLVNKLHWRYATKKFNRDKKVPEENITELLKGVNLAPSSYGLQPYKVLVVHSNEIKKKLREVSYHQAQIVDGSHIFIFAAKKDISEREVDEYINRIAQVREVPHSELKDFKQSIQNTLDVMSDSEKLQWAEKQAYLGLGVLLALCTDMKIDACPMEGFENEKYNQILDLDSEGYHAAVIAAVGYRRDDDDYAKLAKVRKELDDFVDLRY